uniref:Uncharacterized protein n=1 Tax=Knipowitschia caucasica TaxID=637954 RepID=A0AAV2KNM2_KNICA
MNEWGRSLVVRKQNFDKRHSTRKKGEQISGTRPAADQRDQAGNRSAGPGREQISGTRQGADQRDQAGSRSAGPGREQISGTRPGADQRDQAGSRSAGPGREQISGTRPGADQRDQAGSRSAGPGREQIRGTRPQQIRGTRPQGQETQKRPHELSKGTCNILTPYWYCGLALCPISPSYLEASLCPVLWRNRERVSLRRREEDATWGPPLIYTTLSRRRLKGRPHKLYKAHNMNYSFERN